MTKASKIAQAIAEQVKSNRSGVGHETDFVDHRARVTQEILARAPADGRGRLCLLGAGNAIDVDLRALAARFSEVHLVDVDAEAVQGAQTRAPPAMAARLILHAPVDVSGVFEQLDKWAVTPPEARAFSQLVDDAVARVLAQLPGPFDVVVSCSLLTQMQLVLLQVVTDRNPRFGELRALLSRIHVRVLARLLGPAGVALLVTDLTSNDTYPLEDLEPDTDLRALMENLVGVGNVIHAAHPGLLSAEIRRHPELSAAYAVRSPIGPWLWHNGAVKVFLVYAIEISARAPTTA
jgi:hypothetical protein